MVWPFPYCSCGYKRCSRPPAPRELQPFPPGSLAAAWPVVDGGGRCAKRRCIRRNAAPAAARGSSPSPWARVPHQPSLEHLWTMHPCHWFPPRASSSEGPCGTDGLQAPASRQDLSPSSGTATPPVRDEHLPAGLLVTASFISAAVSLPGEDPALGTRGTFLFPSSRAGGSAVALGTLLRASFFFMLSAAIALPSAFSASTPGLPGRGKSGYRRQGAK